MWEYRDKIIHFRVVYSLKHFIFVKELNIGYLVVMAKILKLGANRKWYKKSWEIRTWKYLKINWKMHNYVLEWRKEAKSISRINIMHKNMHYKKIIIDIFAVTFRKEGVDWNEANIAQLAREGVTFRKEGVDWNLNDEGEDEAMIRHLP